MSQVLRSVPLRSWANQMAYYDKQTLATEDAMRIGRLHTFLPGKSIFLAVRACIFRNISGVMSASR